MSSPFIPITVGCLPAENIIGKKFFLCCIVNHLPYSGFTICSKLKKKKIETEVLGTVSASKSYKEMTLLGKDVQKLTAYEHAKIDITEKTHEFPLLFTSSSVCFTISPIYQGVIYLYSLINNLIVLCAKSVLSAL